MKEYSCRPNDTKQVNIRVTSMSIVGSGDTLSPNIVLKTIITAALEPLMILDGEKRVG
jgi:hypothetical protein